jgi:hypothetical protein
MIEQIKEVLEQSKRPLTAGGIRRRITKSNGGLYAKSSILTQISKQGEDYGIYSPKHGKYSLKQSISKNVVNSIIAETVRKIKKELNGARSEEDLGNILLNHADKLTTKKVLDQQKQDVTMEIITTAQRLFNLNPKRTKNLIFICNGKEYPLPADIKQSQNNLLEFGLRFLMKFGGFNNAQKHSSLFMNEEQKQQRYPDGGRGVVNKLADDLYYYQKGGKEVKQQFIGAIGKYCGVNASFRFN